MPINEEAKKRILASKIAPEIIAETIESICASSEALGGGSAELKLDYLSDGMVLKPGDMVPFIILGARTVEVETELDK
jgi:hypothetical protein